MDIDEKVKNFVARYKLRLLKQNIFDRTLARKLYLSSVIDLPDSRFNTMADIIEVNRRNQKIDSVLSKFSNKVDSICKGNNACKRQIEFLLIHYYVDRPQVLEIMKKNIDLGDNYIKKNFLFKDDKSLKNKPAFLLNYDSIGKMLKTYSINEKDIKDLDIPLYGEVVISELLSCGIRRFAVTNRGDNKTLVSQYNKWASKTLPFHSDIYTTMLDIMGEENTDGHNNNTDYVHLSPLDEQIYGIGEHYKGFELFGSGIADIIFFDDVARMYYGKDFKHLSREDMKTFPQNFEEFVTNYGIAFNTYVASIANVPFYNRVTLNNKNAVANAKHIVLRAWMPHSRLAFNNRINALYGLSRILTYVYYLPKTNTLLVEVAPRIMVDVSDNGFFSQRIPTEKEIEKFKKMSKHDMTDMVVPWTYPTGFKEIKHLFSKNADRILYDYWQFHVATLAIVQRNNGILLVKSDNKGFNWQKLDGVTQLEDKKRPTLNDWFDSLAVEFFLDDPKKFHINYLDGVAGMISAGILQAMILTYDPTKTIQQDFWEKYYSLWRDFFKKYISRSNRLASGESPLDGFPFYMIAMPLHFNSIADFKDYIHNNRSISLKLVGGMDAKTAIMDNIVQKVSIGR